MRLIAVGLHNWKAYRRAQIRFPVSANGRNVVIVEGNNGAGKTSLLEAITLCLFGRHGLTLVARAGTGDRPDLSYTSFLERAVNASARGEATRMTVSLEFQDGEDLIGIERTWHFSASGRLRGDDEEVRLAEGPDLDLVTLPPRPEVDEFVRGFVARRLLADNLARFFLLDGEHIERLSGHSVDQQVWSAIESVLGAPVLRSLSADLRAYARERRRQLPQQLTEKTQKVENELRALEHQDIQASSRVEDLLARLVPLRKKRDDIVKRIGTLHGDSYRTFKALFEERERLTRMRDEKRDELRRLLSGDVALALAGPALRKRAIERLATEDRTARWETSSQASKSRFDDFISALQARLSDSIPVDQLRGAWYEVWSKRPADCAEDIRHKHLGDADRQAVSEHLQLLASVRADTIGKLSKDVTVLDEGISRCENDIGRQRGVDEESQGLADELTTIQGQIADLESRHRGELQASDELHRKLRAKREEADVLLADGASAAPLIARAVRAEQFAELADRLVDAALPANLEEVSQIITRSYREMAHKTVVENVKIVPGHPVQLLDANHEDIRRIDASAGESQIFALSVMSALAQMAGDFPIIMDTPLARLDPLHRRNVLNHFARGTRQLVLLTHPAELGQNEMDVLEPYLAGVLRIGGQNFPTAAAKATI
ncbi:AAA family ATPase [Rhizobium sp. CBN3]|uniref:AAA family ATPase n=1 Tax=Rhizobium sp. CBN3 TaxID=3058045 RepID=UPI002673CA36|nr:AAA family ATPase [Rhizobium sp. CBN3]MDO3431925.1 AAA family ATPase [Rhizobium sp. CBN3]